MLLHYLAKFEHSDNRQTLLQISRAHSDTDGTSYDGRSKSLAVIVNFRVTISEWRSRLLHNAVKIYPKYATRLPCETEKNTNAAQHLYFLV